MSDTGITEEAPESDTPTDLAGAHKKGDKGNNF